MEKTIIIVSACHDHALHMQCSRGGRSRELPYLSNIVQVIVDGLASLVNVCCHLKVYVKPRTEITDGGSDKWHCQLNQCLGLKYLLYQVVAEYQLE